MWVELITLQHITDMFNYLPLGGISTIWLPHPINIHCPQHAASLVGKIHIRAHGQMGHIVDNIRSQIVVCGISVG